MRFYLVFERSNYKIQTYSPRRYLLGPHPTTAIYFLLNHRPNQLDNHRSDYLLTKGDPFLE